MKCQAGLNGGSCVSCQTLDPPIKPCRDPGPPTLVELLDGLAQDIERLEERERRARRLADQWSGDVASAHARAEATACVLKRNQMHQDLRMWRTYLSAHPGSEGALIGVGHGCKHSRGIGQHPTCWDGERREYVRDVGEDDERAA